MAESSCQARQMTKKQTTAATTCICYNNE